MDGIDLSIQCLPPRAAREEWLSEAERAHVAALGFGERRRNEWVRGRVAARGKLTAKFGDEVAAGLSLLSDEDGAPRLEGKSDCAISLSHDGDYFAVAISDAALTRVAVDICLPQHQARLHRVFSRLGMSIRKRDLLAAWAGLECFLKLRRMGIATLLDTPVMLTLSDDGIQVSAFGSTVSFALLRHELFVVAWGGETS